MAPVRQGVHGVGTTGSAESTRPSLRDGFNAYSALSLVHRAFWPPSPARCGKHRRKFDISVGISGPRAFAVRSRHRSSSDIIRVHRSPPRVRDDAYAPLIGAGWVYCRLFLEKRKRNFFVARPEARHLIEMVGKLFSFCATDLAVRGKGSPASRGSIPARRANRCAASCVIQPGPLIAKSYTFALSKWAAMGNANSVSLV